MIPTIHCVAPTGLGWSGSLFRTPVGRTSKAKDPHNFIQLIQERNSDHVTPCQYVSLPLPQTQFFASVTLDNFFSPLLPFPAPRQVSTHGIAGIYAAAASPFPLNMNPGLPPPEMRWTNFSTVSFQTHLGLA
jgi:hypothetical protein